MIKLLLLFLISVSANASTISADNFLSTSGNTMTPSFYVSTGGGNTGFYFGANGASFGYNGAEVASFISNVWKMDAQLQAAFVGSAGTPAFYLDADPNAGFWDIGLNHWGWSANSAKVLDMSTTGLGITGALNVSGTTTLASSLTGVTRAASGVISAAELSGDITTSGSNVTTLKNTGAGSGSCTYCSVTFDAQGRETAYSSGTSPVTSLSVVTANGLAGSSSGGTTPALTLSTTINAPVLAGNGTAISAATTTGSGSTAVLATGPTMTNPIVGTQSLGDNSTKAASTAFVQSALNQLNPAAAVYAASTANIAGTYTNAVSGVCVGDTFTTTATTAFALDGTSPPVGSRVLFKNQTSGFQNGVWTLTTQAVGGVSGAVLTRALDWDSSTDMNAGGLIPVINGTVNASTVWFQTATITTCSSDSEVFAQFTSGTTSPLTTKGDVWGYSSTNARIPIGSDGQVLTADSTQTLGVKWAAAGSSSISYSYVYLDGGNGHDGTNTAVRKYSTTEANVGSDFTVDVNKEKITVNNGGTYIFCAGDQAASGPVASGIVLNSVKGTTSILSLLYSDGLRSISQSNGANSVSSCAAITMNANDFIWVQDNGAATPVTSNLAWLVGVKVSTAQESNIYLENASGHGATNTKIRTFTNNRSNNGGSDITYTSNATNGDSFTINTAGNYFVCYSDSQTGTGGLAAGITVNDLAMTTAIGSSSYFNGVRGFNGLGGTAAASTSNNCYADWFNTGDVIRAHDDGTGNSTDITTYFFIQKMGNTNDTSIEFFNVGNGHGSSDTTVRRYSTIAKVVSSNATGNQSSIDGDSIYAATDAIYLVCGNENGGTPLYGFVSTILPVTTGITSNTYANGLRGVLSETTAGVNANLCIPLFLKAGSRMFPSDNGGNTGATAFTFFTMKRVY